MGFSFLRDCNYYILQKWQNNKEHNKKWSFFPDHPYKILIITKNKCIAQSKKEQDDIDKIYLYEKELSEPKYESLIKKREDVGIKYLKDLNAFIGCSNTVDDVYENIDDYNSSRKTKILIVFDDMIADITTNKKIEAIIKELLIR